MSNPIHAANISIDIVDAYEISEALRWLCDWLTSDPALATSLHRYTHGLISLDGIVTELTGLAGTLEGVLP